MEPCDAGFMRCSKHRERMTKRAMAVLLEGAQERVLRRVEQALDDTIDTIIDLSQNSRNDSVKLAASKELLTLAGFANIRIEGDVGVTLDPENRDAALLKMIQGLAHNPDKLLALEERSKVIDADVVDDDA
jgi:hypothetical protein